jgi:mRNA-degrading endonuclease RelE of RelBE toxin-antitoxin system
MITFSSISYFNQRVDALKKVRRGVYATIDDEIRTAFQNQTIVQIRQNRDMVLIDDDHIIIKLRLPDKKHRLSRKDGFRLLYLVYKDVEEVAFLDVYPKNGPLQQLDINDTEIVRLVELYACEKEKGQLTTVNL